MIDRLISSLLVFILSLAPAGFNKVDIDKSSQTSIIFTGDVMLGRSVMGETVDKNDFYYPFRKTADFLKSSDITFINLENAIIKNCPRIGKGSFTFCTSPEIAQGLEFSGVDIVTLANNHSGNYGNNGLIETKKYLSDMGIKWVDGTNCEILEKNNVRFGFVGLDFVYKNLRTEDLELISECKGKSDILIVGPHWGEEYKSISNSLQTTAAKQMIENGADIVIGHHPHVVQNYEEINPTSPNGLRWARPIYYSLGNFIFDQMWSEETKKGLIVKMTFENMNLVKREEFKTYIKNIGQPEIVKE